MLEVVIYRAPQVGNGGTDEDNPDGGGCRLPTRCSCGCAAEHRELQAGRAHPCAPDNVTVHVKLPTVVGGTADVFVWPLAAADARVNPDVARVGICQTPQGETLVFKVKVPADGVFSLSFAPPTNGTSLNFRAVQAGKGYKGISTGNPQITLQ